MDPSIVNFTHYDLDGVGASLAIRAAFPQSQILSIIPCAYGVGSTNLNTRIDKFISAGLYKKYNLIFVTDLSLCDDVYARLKDVDSPSTRIYYIDHHLNENRPSIKSKNFMSVISSENKASAALLTFNLLRSIILKNNDIDISKVSRFIQIIDDYDRWVMSEPASIPLNILFFHYGFWTFYARFCNFDLNLMQKEIDLVKHELKLIEQYKRQSLENCYLIEPTNIVLVPHMKKYANEVGDYIMKNGYDAVIMLVDQDDTSTRLSIRTSQRLSWRDDLDLGCFLQTLGGGGAKSVGGVICKTEELKDVVENIALYLDKMKEG